VVSETLKYFSEADFIRDDENLDNEFYSRPRLVSHLDSLALDTVTAIYARLIPKDSDVLDLMAGPDSHLEEDLNLRSITGLGMNNEELQANSNLNERIIHDLNADWRLPFDDNRFDVAINTVSVDYLVRPVDVFSEVGRVLRPRGIFIVVFSNRMFPPKAVNIWKNTLEKDRMDLVKKFISLTGKFQIQGYSESKGRPRPKDDKYYKYGIPSDPIYVIWSSVIK
jgi:SAM-dependent methyltransferase